MADVRVDVQVTQGKDLVSGLGQDDFIVTDEGQPQTIVSFEHGDEPVNLLLLFDISESMQPFIEQIGQSAREALDHLRPADRVAIMVFARTTAVHQDFSDNLAESARQELERLDAELDAKAEIMVEGGDAPKAVCRAAGRFKSDLLVIARGSAAGISGRLRTNAYAIIRGSPCAVVSV